MLVYTRVYLEDSSSVGAGLSPSDPGCEPCRVFPSPAHFARALHQDHLVPSVRKTKQKFKVQKNDPQKILVTGNSYLSPRWPIDHSQALQKKLRTDSQVPGRSSSPAAAVLVVLRWCSLAPQLETRKSSWLIHVDHLIIQMFNTSMEFLLSTLQSTLQRSTQGSHQKTAKSQPLSRETDATARRSSIKIRSRSWVEKKKRPGAKNLWCFCTLGAVLFPNLGGVEIFIKKNHAEKKCQLNPQDWLQVKMPCLHQMNSQHPRGIHLQDPRASC